MTRSIADKRTAFRALHQTGCFVIPNPWDAGSARMLEHLGFAALASSSAGFAWSTGRADNAVTLDAVLGHLRVLVDAVGVPVNADFEAGFAREPDGVARNVALAIETGVAGLSIEDRSIEAPTSLYATDLAVERIRAARAAIDTSATGTVLVARTEGLLIDGKAVTQAIDRLVAFAAAGADCLFAPGVREPADIAAMVRAVAPRPVNVVISAPGLTVAALADLGVRRISVGGGLARAAYGAALAVARQLHAGSFAGFAGVASGGELNAIFK